MAEHSFSSKGSRRGRAVREREVRWADTMARWQASGLTQAAFCSRERIPLSTLRYWRHRLRARNGHGGRLRRPSFLAVRVLDSVRPASSPFEIALPGGRVVRVPSDFEPEALRNLLSALTDATLRSAA